MSSACRCSKPGPCWRAPDDRALDDRTRGNARQAGAAGIHAAGVAVSCPVCGKPAEAAYRPFCSRRCADVDLGRWFNEDYRIPVPEADEGPDDDRET
ncbi:MAG: DNA gyrase inhibitor YacG, partial [Rhodospirillaceae bacterium]|nr:DNA gyrase inhibitor YacG [Rhodospirillaceae bacterium]